MEVQEMRLKVIEMLCDDESTKEAYNKIFNENRSKKCCCNVARKDFEEIFTATVNELLGEDQDIKLASFLCVFYVSLYNKLFK